MFSIFYLLLSILTHTLVHPGSMQALLLLQQHHDPHQDHFSPQKSSSEIRLDPFLSTIPSCPTHPASSIHCIPIPPPKDHPLPRSPPFSHSARALHHAHALRSAPLARSACRRSASAWCPSRRRARRWRCWAPRSRWGSGTCSGRRSLKRAWAAGRFNSVAPKRGNGVVT